MSSTRPLALILVVMSLLAWGAHASDLNHRIELDLVDAPAADVLSALGLILEADVTIDEAIDGDISIRLHGVSVRTVLSAVCESLRCRWKLDETDGVGRLSFVPLTDPVHGSPAPAEELLRQLVNVSLAGATGVDVLESLAGILGSELRLSCESAEQPITVEVQNVPVREAIDMVCERIDCVCLIEPDALTVR